jgi:hypothetical protein
MHVLKLETAWHSVCRWEVEVHCLAQPSLAGGMPTLLVWHSVCHMGKQLCLCQPVMVTFMTCHMTAPCRCYALLSHLVAPCMNRVQPTAAGYPTIVTAQLTTINRT